MLLIRLFPILILSTFEQITFFWNQGVYTPTLKKHQVVRDLKKFENHWFKRIKTLYIENLFWTSAKWFWTSTKRWK